MSDFFLDLRPPNERQTALAADRLKFFKDVTPVTIEHRRFSAVIARSDRPETWAPFSSPDLPITVLLAGRIALEPEDWRSARDLKTPGGLACKAIFQKYLASGIAALKELNGNFTVIFYDGREDVLFIVTDRAGVAPVFRADDPLAHPVFSSNPDLLAAAIGVWDDLDLTSMGEFLATSKVSFPFTYYNRVKGLDYGSITSVKFGEAASISVSTAKYYEFTYTGSDNARDNESLAHDLANAFRNSVRRRTQPEMGKSLLALSGGLDSRTVLSACPPDMQTFSFCDEDNYETRTAAQIAEARGADNLKFQRDFEHYGGTIAAAARAQGGMGRFESNIYLGFRDHLRELGVENLLTGCYCDYLFKGVTLNRRVRPLLRTNQLAPFSHFWLLPIYKFDSSQMPAITNRIEAIIPVALRNKTDDATMFNMEAARLLPLSNEPDARGIQHRLVGWCAPIADIEILEVYRRTPWELKLNNAMFLEMMNDVCPPEILRITDTNTGAPVDSSEFGRFIGRWKRMVHFQTAKFRSKRITTAGSAPNWGRYVCQSKKLDELWNLKNPLATEVLERILGYNPFQRPLSSWIENQQMELILRLIVLKVWLDVRIRMHGDPGPQ